MKVAAAAYPQDVLTSWAQYEDKLHRWVSEAAQNGADLLVFPEYGAMELATLTGGFDPADLEEASHLVSDRVPDADALHVQLSAEFGVHILTASAPVFEGARPMNRARLVAPDGQIGIQDKQIMTRYERDPWDVVPGGPLTLFDTAIGKIGVLICYDSEFPLLGRALSEADVILAPSCTEALAGYWRVRIGAMARALENQCVSVMSSLVGPAPWCDAIASNTGAGGIFCPPDIGFPQSGVLAVGDMNTPCWTFADVDLAAIAKVRADGGVLNRKHWEEQDGRITSATIQKLR